MTQWVKNLIAVTQVTAELQVRYLAWHSGLEDPALAHELPCAMALAIKKKKKITVWSLPFLSIAQENWSGNWNKHLYTKVNSLIHNVVETTQMFTNSWMDEQDVVYTYNGILFGL